MHVDRHAADFLDLYLAEFAILQRFAGTRPDPITRAAAAVEWRRVRDYEADLCRRSDVTK